MLEELLSALIRSQVGDLKRRTTGAIFEGAALGMVGLATVFLSVGFYVFLSQRMEPWLAALIIALIATLVAVVLALIGRSLLSRRDDVQRVKALSTLKGLGLLSSSRHADKRDMDGEVEPGPALLAAALAVGLILARTLKR